MLFLTRIVAATVFQPDSLIVELEIEFLDSWMLEYLPYMYHLSFHSRYSNVTELDAIVKMKADLNVSLIRRSR